jgi:alpha 1,3-glucosidase
MRSPPIIVTILLVLLVGDSFAVDRNKFKRCDEASFCTRQRETTPHYLDYKIIESTVQVKGNTFYSDVADSKTQKELTLEITGYNDNIFRLKINEKESLRKRYEVHDVILSEALVEVPFTRSSESLATVLKYQNGASIRIEHNPLKVELLKDGEVFITANNRGLLNFEQYRTRQETKEGDSESAVLEVWEEHYKEHKDSRQYGNYSIFSCD